MPYYQQGPEDYYGPQSGFDAYSGRLNGGQLVMAFMNQLQAIKQRKQEEQDALQDRQWKQVLQGLQKTKYEQDIEAGKREAAAYKTPEQQLEDKKAWERFVTDENIRQNIALEEARAKREAANAKIKAGEDQREQERLDAVDRLRTERANAKAKQAKYKELVTQIGAAEKLRNGIRLSISKAKTDAEYETLRQQLFEVNASIESMDAQRQAIAEEYIGKSEPDKAQKRLPADLPKKRGGFLGIGKQPTPYVPERKSTRRFATDGQGNRIYTDDGTNWFDEKTGNPIK